MSDQPKPTKEEVDFACLSFRHDFGLLSAKEADGVRDEAQEWLRAWLTVLDMTATPTPEKEG